MPVRAENPLIIYPRYQSAKNSVFLPSQLYTVVNNCHDFGRRLDLVLFVNDLLQDLYFLDRVSENNTDYSMSTFSSQISKLSFAWLKVEFENKDMD